MSILHPVCAARRKCVSWLLTGIVIISSANTEAICVTAKVPFVREQRSQKHAVTECCGGNSDVCAESQAFAETAK